MTEHRISIGTDGSISFIYSDDLVGVMALGDATVTRASHVEPFARGGWYADMRPSGGPVLFQNGELGLTKNFGVNEFELRAAKSSPGDPVGFTTRAEALSAEIDWLRENKGL